MWLDLNGEDPRSQVARLAPANGGGAYAFVERIQKLLNGSWFGDRRMRPLGRRCGPLIRGRRRRCRPRRLISGRPRRAILLLLDQTQVCNISLMLFIRFCKGVSASPIGHEEK